ncbi:titin homolog isoform X2 [Mercenaria mercenaria]|uniref:titin homolog isoform X2 n=1 Tax=Mercenaria mercenaria TaxID=6596 RepID=UPI00234E77D5|nr:titin homolog isoform X2 [Mercenaria mercenaria]
MQRKMKNCESSADISKTPVRKTSRNGSARVTPNNDFLSKGRRSRTTSPGSSSVPSISGRRSITSTPESTSTQRELKKLEDYWTRNNPVPEDSPRLRSNRKSVFNLKECIGESSYTRTFQKDETRSQQLKTVEQKSLPESPIPKTITQDKCDPFSSLTFENCDNNTISHRNEKTGKCSGSPDIFTNFQERGNEQREIISPACSPMTKLSQLEPTLDRSKKYGRDAVIQNSICQNSISGGAATGLTDYDSSDSDDDDYVPPRKKLRSEVSKDELWDGIPLTISFKRLAPISKTTADKTTNDISQTKLVNSRAYKDITSEKQEVLDDTRSLVKLDNFQKHSNRTDPVSCDNDRNCITKIVPTDSVQGNSKLKENHQRTKRKRSTRLKEKLTAIPVNKDNFNESITSEDTVPVRVKLCSVAISSNAISQVNEDGGETCLRKLDTTQDKMTNDYQGESLLKLTLSQILSVDNKSDISASISNETKDVTEEKTKYECESGTEGTPASVKTSISKTINDIFEEISGPNILSQNSSNKTDANINNLNENDSRTTRRTRRLSGIEITKSNLNSPNIKNTNDDHEILAAGLAFDAKASNDDKSNNTAKDGECSTKASEISSSKHKLFTKNTNKWSKTVPPLRIKLKHPATVTSKKKCDSKLKQKDSAVIKGKATKPNKLNTGSTIKAPETKTDFKKIREKQASPTDSDEAGTSKKTDVTPNNKKKKAARQRKWSPPPSSTIALRLNSERRLSAAGSLLSNALLNKHACVLWSSENRRHMQLSNPNATLSELDMKLSRKWDNLSDKEKLRYFQRARDAIRDENRHSNRQTNVLSSEIDTAKQYADDCSVENFQKLSPASQMTEIKKWLNFYNEISPETCSQVITSFKEALAEENRNKVRKENEQEKARIKSKSKKNKQKKKEDVVTTIDNNANYRKLLFEKIQSHKEKVKDILTGKRKEKYKSVLDNYSSIVKRMVCGEVLHFAGDVRSDKLTETLYELRALEKDNRLAVTGDMYRDTEYEDILARLCTRNSPDAKTLVCALDNADIDDKELENTCKKIRNFPSLSPNSLANNLPEQEWTPKTSEMNLLSPLRFGRSNRTSPVTVLTEMVAEDLLRSQPQIGFRNAISLLSNKVVPSPTLILPPKGANGCKTSANKNQNCNVVYTKLQSRPSALTTKVNLLN